MLEHLFDFYEDVGMALALLALPVVTFGSWYCLYVSYGFVLGVGLGWIPAVLCGFVCALAAKWLWPVPVIWVTWLIAR